MRSDHGWQHALDVQMDQLKWQNSDLGKAVTEGFFESIISKSFKLPPGGVAINTMYHESLVRETLWRADTMYITTDMQHLIMQAAHDMPEDYTFDFHNLLCPIGFCLFEETMYGFDKANRKMAISGLSWNWMESDPDKPTLVLHFWTPSDDTDDDFNNETLPILRERGYAISPMILSHIFIMYDNETVYPGKKAGSPQGSELVDAMITLFAAMNTIAHQTIGEPIRMTPDRAVRKRVNKFFGMDRMITLITLRRKSAKKEHDPNAPPVPWSRRWIVRGHWRKQWYPKTQRHDWKYIYEYVKGPEDMPLVVTERRVFNFRR